MTSQPMRAENSVTFSLAELARLEEERQREREVEEAKARAERARKRAEVEAARRAEEVAALRASEEARAQRARAEAEEQARLEARKKAMLDVARIEAEAKARLEADNAARAHELAMAQVSADRRVRSVRNLLAAALGLAVVGASFGAYAFTGKLEKAAQDNASLQGEKSKLGEERDRARAAEAEALEAKKAALGEGKRERAARFAALEGRRGDLAAWAAERKRPEVLAKVDAAAERAKGHGDDRLKELERALDHAREKLGAEAPVVRGGHVGATPKEEGIPCVYGADPLCGINGRRL